jgi:hypothetical protein
MISTEADTHEDLAATLELNDGASRLLVYFTVRETDGTATGYLRLAYGQGNYVNRLLNSVGGTGHLVGPNGASRRITLTSSDPTEMPGYLCTFTF